MIREDLYTRHVEFLFVIILVFISTIGFSQNYTNYTTLPDGTTYKTTISTNGNNSYVNTTKLDTNKPTGTKPKKDIPKYIQDRTHEKKSHCYTNIFQRHENLLIYSEKMQIDTLYGPVDEDSGRFLFSIRFYNYSQRPEYGNPIGFTHCGYYNGINADEISGTKIRKYDRLYVDDVNIKSISQYSYTPDFDDFFRKLHPGAKITVKCENDNSKQETLILSEEQYNAIINFYKN